MGRKESVHEEEVEHFLSSEDSVLSPPYFAWQPLRTFLGGRHSQDYTYPEAVPNRLSRCIVDRILPLSDELARRESDVTLCSSDSHSHHVERKILTDREILDRLGAAVGQRSNTIDRASDLIFDSANGSTR
jgi:hypothetical protein